MEYDPTLNYFGVTINRPSIPSDTISIKQATDLRPEIIFFTKYLELAEEWMRLF